MSWYKSPEWKSCLEAMDEWFFESKEYINEGGGRRIKGYWSMTSRLVDALLDVAHLDPMPVWDVYRFISNRESNLYNGTGTWESVSVPEISDRLQQVMMLRERCERTGVVKEKPDWTGAAERKTSPKQQTRDVIKGIEEGLENPALCERYGITTSNATTIRNRYENGEYEL